MQQMVYVSKDDEPLVAEAKSLAVGAGKKFSDLVIEGLRYSVGKARAKQKRAQTERTDDDGNNGRGD